MVNSEDDMDRIVDVVLRRPKANIVLVLLATAVLGSGIGKLETRNNYEGDLPPDDPIVQTNALYESVFGDEQLLLVAVESPDLFSPQTLSKISAISRDLGELKDVPPGGVTSLATIAAAAARPAVPGKATASTHDMEADGSQEAKVAGLVDQGLVSRDQTTALVVVRVDSDADQTTVARRVRDVISTYEGPERIYAIGDLTVAQDIDDGIEGDLGILLPLAIVFILAGFYASFRTAVGVLLPLAVILLSIVWTLGLMGHLGVHLNVVTSTIPILLVASASSYGIHLVQGHREAEREGPNPVRSSLKALGRPVLLTGLTSVVGTLSLLVFRIVSIREFGVFAAAGILFAAITALVLIPSILALLARGKPTTCTRGRAEGPDRVGDVLARIGLFSLARARLVIVLALAAVAVSLVGISRIRVGLDPVALFPEGHPVRQSTRVLTERFGGCRYFNVMVDSRRSGGAFEPSLLASVSSFARAAEGIQGISSGRSLVDLLANLSGSAGEEMMPGSEGEARGLYAAAHAVVGPSELGRWIDEDHRRLRLTFMVTATDQEAQLRIYERLQDLAEAHLVPSSEVAFGGSALLWIAQNRYVAIGKLLNILAAMALVLIFCAAAFRSVRRGAVTVAPLAVATVITFGIMGFAGIRLNMATAIITSLAVGIGVDFAIHYYSRLASEQAEGRTLHEATVRCARSAGKAICIDVASNVLGFAVFCLSGFAPIRHLGWLISLTMLTCAAGTLVLLPALAGLAKRKESEAEGSRHQTQELATVRPVAMGA